MPQVADLFAKLRLTPDKRSFTAGDRLISGIKKGIAAVAAFKAGQAFRGMVTDVANAADHYNKFSQAVGISSENLQGLDFAAQLSGTDVQTLGTSLQRLSKTADQASRGNKLAKDTFKELGVAYKDANGNLRQTDDILNDIADRISEMPNGTEKTAAAINIFGRSGAKLIPLLNAGSDGIKSMKAEFVELGGQIDQKTGAQFEFFNDQQLRLQTAIGGVKKQIVIALLPSLLSLTKGMLSWVKANRELLKQRLSKLLRGLVVVLASMGKTLAFVVENWKGLAVALTSLKLASVIMGIVTAMQALKIASLRAALASAAAWISATLPFVLLAALIAAVILIIEDLWRAFTGGESVFKDLYLAAKKWIGEELKRVIDDASEAIVDFLELGDAKDAIAGELRNIVSTTKKVVDPLERERDLPLEERIRRRESRLFATRARAERAEQIHGPESFSAQAARRVLTREEGELGLLRAQRTARPVDQSTTQINAPITVNANTSQPEDVAEAARRGAQQVWDENMRSAAAGTGR